MPLPDGVPPATLETDRGSFATLTAVPQIGTPLGTVLLVPGWTGSKEDFTPLVDHLCRYGWRTVAVHDGGADSGSGPARSVRDSRSGRQVGVLAGRARRGRGGDEQGTRRLQPAGWAL